MWKKNAGIRIDERIMNSVEDGRASSGRGRRCKISTHWRGGPNGGNLRACLKFSRDAPRFCQCVSCSRESFVEIVYTDNEYLTNVLTNWLLSI